MKRIYIVCVRWVVSTVNPPLLDAVLTECGDWMRFNAETWVLETVMNPTDIRTKIIKHLTPTDNCLLLPIELGTTPADGWVPPWIWEWLNSRARAILDERARAAAPTFNALMPPPPS